MNGRRPQLPGAEGTRDRRTLRASQHWCSQSLMRRARAHRGRAFGARIAAAVDAVLPVVDRSRVNPFHELQDCGAPPCRKRAGGSVPSPSPAGAHPFHDARGDIASELETVIVAHVAASPKLCRRGHVLADLRSGSDGDLAPPLLVTDYDDRRIPNVGRFPQTLSQKQDE